MTQSELIEVVLQNTEPLKYPRGERFSLYVWALTGVGTSDDSEAKQILGELDARGIAVVSPWRPGQQKASLEEGLRIARMQGELGLRVNVNATAVLNRFFDGSLSTAHVGESGEAFFDTTFSKNVKMGCPFALEGRYDAIRKRVEHFADGYREAGIDVDFAFADWEVDGPIEWNGAWEHSRRCVRCRENIPDIHEFGSFQKALRTIHSDMQRAVFAEVMKSHFSEVLVGNYAVYPHNGERYWYDYFEKLEEGMPFRADQNAKYRPWAHEFESTGYTFAMPVVYTWYPTYLWYNFQHSDYRWFYNMLMVGTNAAENTPTNTPIVTFVHWHTTSPPEQPDPEVRQFSKSCYQELLWHLLFRGHDALFLWCPPNELEEEIQLVHQVFSEAQQYGEFLDKGQPIGFQLPVKEGPVISGLRVEDRVLVRRTEFGNDPDPVSFEHDGRSFSIPRSEGECQVLRLP